MIEIKEVTSRYMMRKFCNFPLKLYKGNPYYIPCFFDDEMALFGKKNVFSDFCDSRFFLAYKDGKLAGRIALIINHADNQKMNQLAARFSRLDMIDDIEVTRALFARAEQVAREEYGMTKMHGPLGYIDIDKEGMLTKGFEYSACYGGVYNFDYYNRHMEQLGYVKEIDWLERLITVPKEPDERLHKMAEMIKQRYHLRDAVTNESNVKEVVKQFGAPVFELINKAYGKLHGVVPIPPRVAECYIKQMTLILQSELISLIVDENDKLIALGVVFPQMGPAVNKCKGKIIPFGVLPLIKAMKHYDKVELAIVAVDPVWQSKAVISLVMDRIMRNLIAKGVKYADTDGTLENNYEINNLWERFEHVKHKRRRCYVKEI